MIKLKETSFMQRIEQRITEFRKHRIGDTIYVIRNGCCLKGEVIIINPMMLSITFTYTKLDGKKSDITISY